MLSARRTSPRASGKILPSSRQSASATRSTFSLRMAWARARTRPRSGPGVDDHPANAFAAASTAAFASAAPLLGNSPRASRVSAGFTHASYLSVEGGTHTPPIQFFRRSSPAGMRMQHPLRPSGSGLNACRDRASSRAPVRKIFLRRFGKIARKCALRTRYASASVRAPFPLTQGLHALRYLLALLARPGNRPRDREHAVLHSRNGHRLERTLGRRRAAGVARRQEGPRRPP